MKSKLFYAYLLSLGGLALAGAGAQAEQRPKGPDFASVATEIGVPESALMACIGQKPAPGQRPARPDPAKIATCLADAGQAVSAETVDAALARAAPPPRG